MIVKYVRLGDGIKLQRKIYESGMNTKKLEKKDVHTEHCCWVHGCKYCSEDCTVATGQKKQSFRCELCGDAKEEQERCGGSFDPLKSDSLFYMPDPFAVVEEDTNKRWEKGMPHHPKSIAIYNLLEKSDMKYGGDYFCWKCGGDGDNGETLMYSLDVLFEKEERAMGGHYKNDPFGEDNMEKLMELED
jgi:hypothetical protein